MNDLQKIVHADLKSKGFKKKGRTHNRQVCEGMVEVINFQMDQYPIGENYEIPGIRKSYWGKFVVNLGVYVEELYTAFYNEGGKPFVQDYHCEIRTRLAYRTTSPELEQWYPLDSNYSEVAEEIILGLSRAGQSWFDRFNDREKIISEFRDNKEIQFSPREKLNAAILLLNNDRQAGERIFNDYLNALDDSIPRIKGHKDFILKVAKRLNITLE